MSQFEVWLAAGQPVVVIVAAAITLRWQYRARSSSGSGRRIAHASAALMSVCAIVIAYAGVRSGFFPSLPNASSLAIAASAVWIVLLFAIPSESSSESDHQMAILPDSHR